MGLLQDARSFHVAGMAVFDWVVTAATAFGIASLFKTKHVAAVFIVLIIIAVLIHYLLGIPTMLNAYIGLAKKEDVMLSRMRAAGQ